MKKVEFELPVETEAVAEALIVKDASVEEKPMDDSKALVVVDKIADSTVKESNGSIDKDTVLARLLTEKKMALIKAWEESEKSKAENKAYKKLSVISLWENMKKATVEAKLKKIEEKLEKKKAELAEQMKNKVAIIHKEAEEKRAVIEAERGEKMLKVEEKASKSRVSGFLPRRILGCFVI